MIAECEVLMLVSLQSYTLLHFKRKQLLRWNVCQLSEDRNIRNIPSVTKGETHKQTCFFRCSKHSSLLLLYKFLRIYSPVLHIQKTMHLRNSKSLLIRVAPQRASGYVPASQREEKLPLTKHSLYLLSSHIQENRTAIHKIDNIV